MEVDHVDLKKPSCRENEGGDMCDRAMRHAAFPGKCGYKSETGGRLKERDATCRDFRGHLVVAVQKNLEWHMCTYWMILDVYT